MISATYSSSVYKTNDEFYETISIDIKRANERTGFAVTFFRHIEKQCFDYDEDGTFMVTPDEWTYVEERHHELLNINRSQITRKLNEITTWAVRKFDVSDVGMMNHHCVMFRNQKKIPFNTELTIENILNDDKAAEFENILSQSLGDNRADSVLKFFRSQLKDFPKSTKEHIYPTVKRNTIPTYASWGEWA